MTQRAHDESEEFERMSAEVERMGDESDETEYLLVLYITGTTTKSVRAITNLKKICEEYLKGRYTLEVVDIYQQPEKAKSGQIVAAPTLIKRLPTPLRTLIGDMAKKERILAGLDLKPKSP